MPELSEQDDREALSKLLFVHDVSNGAGDNAPAIIDLCESAADAILAAGFRRSPAPQQVSTVEELDALPMASIIATVEDMWPRVCHYQSDGVNYWEEPGMADEYVTSSDLVKHVQSLEGVDRRFVVLYRPEGGESE